MLKFYLKEPEFHLVAVDDGKKALSEAMKNDYDVILMDIQMPIMDGFVATKKIREWENQNGKKNVTILALSGFSSSEVEQQALNAGCTGYLVKPVAKKILIETLQKLQRI